MKKNLFVLFLLVLIVACAVVSCSNEPTVVVDESTESVVDVMSVYNAMCKKFEACGGGKESFTTYCDVKDKDGYLTYKLGSDYMTWTCYEDEDKAVDFTSGTSVTLKKSSSDYIWKIDSVSVSGVNSADVDYWNKLLSDSSQIIDDVLKSDMVSNLNNGIPVVVLNIIKNKGLTSDTSIDAVLSVNGVDVSIAAAWKPYVSETDEEYTTETQFTTDTCLVATVKVPGVATFDVLHLPTGKTVVCASGVSLRSIESLVADVCKILNIEVSGEYEDGQFTLTGIKLPAQSYKISIESFKVEDVEYALTVALETSGTVELYKQTHLLRDSKGILDLGIKNIAFDTDVKIDLSLVRKESGVETENIVLNGVKAHMDSSKFGGEYSSLCHDNLGNLKIDCIHYIWALIREGWHNYMNLTDLLETYGVVKLCDGEITLETLLSGNSKSYSAAEVWNIAHGPMEVVFKQYFKTFLKYFEF